MPRWFRNGNGRIQPERQAPENEGNEHDAAAEQQRREALRREEQRRAAERRARQKAEAELNFAKSLYDTTDVKVAGKTAFSKISTLLVRYNRLNDIRKNNEEIANQRKAEEKTSFDKKMADIERQRNDILKSKHTDEWKNERIKELDSKKKNIEELYIDTINRINDFGRSVDQESLTTIDTDNSGIRGTLMLSGKTSAGMGYTLTEGSREDLIKSGMYVDDVSGKDGSLMSQMSLLDNAVNTGGIELDENDRDTGGMGARYNLSHIMRNMTAEDLKLMNSGRGRDLKVDMDLLEESRKDENKMKELFGEEKEKQDIDEAAQERGVEKQIKNSVSDNIINTGVAAFNLIKNKSRIFSSLYKNIKPRQRMRVVKYGLTPEAKLRAMGKAGSVNRPGQAEKYEKLLGSYSGFNTGGGFFGMLGAYSERKRRSFSDDHDKRREYYMERSRTILENLRKRAQNDTERLKRINEGKQPERSPKRVSINENDSFEGAMKRIRINEKSAIDELLAAGELDEKTAAKERQYDDIDRMLKNLSEAQDDKSAAHMMAAYKMMGASKQELLDFRLALIAYMVPSGKKTVAQIVNESHTVGIVGDEGEGNVDENADKDALFSKLRRKADYVERKNKPDEEKQKYKWTVDKKKYRKNQNGEIEVVAEKKEADANAVPEGPAVQPPQQGNQQPPQQGNQPPVQHEVRPQEQGDQPPVQEGQQPPAQNEAVQPPPVQEEIRPQVQEGQPQIQEGPAVQPPVQQPMEHQDEDELIRTMSTAVEIGDEKYRMSVVNDANEPLFGPIDRIEVGQIRQGDTYDCYLLAALASLAKTDPDYIRNTLIKESNDKKKVTVHLFTELGAPIDITISKNSVVGAGNLSALWVTMVEKAAAYLVGRSGNGAGYRKAETAEERRRQVEIGEIGRGSENLAMHLLFGRNRHLTYTTRESMEIAGRQNNAAAKGEAALAAIREGLARKQVVIASTCSNGETDEYNPANDSIRLTSGLKQKHMYTIMGEGPDIDGEKTLRLRDPYGGNTTVPIYRNGGIDFDAGVNDGIFDIKVSDFLRSFTDIAVGGPYKDGVRPVQQNVQAVPEQQVVPVANVDPNVQGQNVVPAANLQQNMPGQNGPVPEQNANPVVNEQQNIQDGNIQPAAEGPQQNVPAQQPEELMDIKTAYGAVSVPGGAQIIAGWQELGDRLWSLAYVEMGKDYLDAILVSVDKLLTHLSEPIPANTDENRNLLAFRARVISMGYKDIIEKGMKLANELPAKDFEGCDEAAQVAVKMCNLAADESRYFNIGSRNYIRHPGDNEDMKGSDPWIKAIMSGKKTLDNAKAKREQQEEQRRRAEEQRRREEDEREKERIRNDWEIVEREQPRENEQQVNEGQPVNEQQQANEQQPVNEQQQENEAQQGAEEEAEIVEPVDENGYIVRWGTFEDRLKKLTDGKLHNADLMFLTNSCQGLKDMLAQNLTKNRAGKYNAGGRDLVRIRSHYNIINESGKKLQETLANANFEGREKVQQLVEKIIDAVAKEVTYLGKGNKKAADHNKDAALNWAGVLVLGKKADEADKRLEAFLAEAEELNREEEARMQRYAQQNGNAAPQDNIAQQENAQQANEGQAVNEAQQEEQENERIRNEWEIVEREQPRENEQQQVNDQHQENEAHQENGQQANEAQQGAGEEAEIVEPVDENGYIVRWDTFERRLNNLTDGKLHNADLMFLTNSCQGLKDMLAQNLTKNRAGKYNAGGRDLVRIRSHYNIINESGKKLQETLANANFEGREKVQQLVEKIIDAVAKEVTYLGKGNKKAADHNKDAALNWAGVLVLGKKADEADKKLEAFLAEAEELNREEEARARRYAQQNGNAAAQGNAQQQAQQENAAAQRDMVNEFVIVDHGPNGLVANDEVKDAAAYIRFWNDTRERLAACLNLRPDANDADVTAVIEKSNRVLSSLERLAGLLSNGIPSGPDLGQKRKTITFIYRYLDEVGADLANRLLDEKFDNEEAARLLLLISNTAFTERKDFIRGALKTGKYLLKHKPQNRGIWADVLVNAQNAPGAQQPGQRQVNEEVNEQGNNAQPEAGAVPGEELNVQRENAHEEEQPNVQQENVVVEEQPNVQQENVVEEEQHNAQQENVQQPQVEEAGNGNLDQDLDALNEEMENDIRNGNAEYLNDDEFRQIDEEIRANNDMLDQLQGEHNANVAQQDRNNRNILRALGMEEENEQEEIADENAGRKSVDPNRNRNRQQRVENGRRSAKPAEAVDVEKLIADEKAREMQALNNGANIVGKQSFVPISTAGKIQNRAVTVAQRTLGALMLPVNLSIAGITKLLLMNKKKKRSRNVQADRSNANIPEIAGRGNKSLADKPVPTDRNGQPAVYGDNRNVPLVWEFVTAGDTGEEPEISINVDQPVKGSAKTSSANNTGHTFISLSYTRFNASTNRDERYALRYGFYPKDGFMGLGLTLNQGMKAMIPGMLKNDRDHSYNISKRYNISVEKINEVLKASEHYSNGGYNVFSRNCTTFAVEMGKTAGIPIADQIKESEFDMGKMAHAGAVFFGTFAQSARYTAEMDFENLLTQEDISYENYGQKMGTVEEINRYKQSRELLPHTPYGHSPSVAGETIRNDQDKTGTIGANLVAKDKIEASEDVYRGAEGLRSRIESAFKAVLDNERERITDNREKEEIDNMIALLEEPFDWEHIKQFPLVDINNRDSFKEYRRSIDHLRKLFAGFVSKYPRYMAECSKEVISYISIMENALKYLDGIYEKSINNIFTGDLRSVRSDYIDSRHTFRYKDDKGTEYRILLENTMIEAYIQMYGSMDKAAPHMAEYTKYKEEYSDKRTTEEKDAVDEKYRNVIKIHKTAQDFAASHNYRLNKQSFDKEDMDYAFKQLPEMEKAKQGATVSGTMYDRYRTPSATVQALIFEPAFRGFTDGIGEMEQLPSAERKAEWIENRLISCLEDQNNKKELVKILRYMYDDAGPDMRFNERVDRFMQTFVKSYVAGAINNVVTFQPELKLVLDTMLGYESRFKKLIRQILNEMIIEMIENARDEE